MKPQLLILPCVLLVACRAESPAPRVSSGANDDINAVVLRVIERMPKGGKYATSTAANQQLSAAIRCAGSNLAVQPDAATPSYCSGATYLVFLGALEELAKGGHISI